MLCKTYMSGCMDVKPWLEKSFVKKILEERKEMLTT